MGGETITSPASTHMLSVK